MPSELPLVYWDACVPLSYIEGIPDRLQHIDAFMQKSGHDLQIITSVLSITEVAFAKSEQEANALDPDAERKISQLWRPGSPIIIVEFFELLARKAQVLIRAAVSNGWSLKPADAIHLATADHLKVSAFHTYDEKLSKFSGLTDTKFPIGPPISQTPLLPFGTSPLSGTTPKLGTSDENNMQAATVTSPPLIPGGGNKPTESEAGTETGQVANSKAEGNAEKREKQINLPVPPTEMAVRAESANCDVIDQPSHHGD